MSGVVRENLPLPSRTWAAERTKVGGRGPIRVRFTGGATLATPPPPNLGPLRGPSPRGEGESLAPLPHLSPSHARGARP
jgi:hypothetical protein